MNRDFVVVVIIVGIMLTALVWASDGDAAGRHGGHGHGKKICKCL